MKQVTLVAYYGRKSSAFEQYIRTCWDHITASPLRHFFAPYHPNQVHATIVGMEKLIGHSENWNANKWRASREKEKHEMNFGRLLEVVRNHSGFTIRFGGYQPVDTFVTSFGERPFVRSFEFQWPQRKVTIMGWHHTDGDFSCHKALWELRDQLDKECNVRHKYNLDHDFFVAIGDIVNLGSLTDAGIIQLKGVATIVADELRKKLANAKPTDLAIKADNIFAIQYEHESLTLNSSRAYCITRKDVTGAFLAGLYEA